VHPLDPAIGIDWPLGEIGGAPLLSPKDAAAPTLEEARQAGQLPRYEDCTAYLDLLRKQSS
jgi:dTDP-4-dehydrorhamnose 3,5-epimerase